MITEVEFNALFNRLISNSWENLPAKDRLQDMRGLYYDKLKNYSIKQVGDAFERFLNDAERVKFPNIQTIIMNINACIEHNHYEPYKPHTAKDKKLQKLFKRMGNQARHIIEQYENDRQKLINCGIKYENLRRKLQKMPEIYSFRHGSKTCMNT